MDPPVGTPCRAQPLITSNYLTSRQYMPHFTKATVPDEQLRDLSPSLADDRPLVARNQRRDDGAGYQGPPPGAHIPVGFPFSRG